MIRGRPVLGFLDSLVGHEERGVIVKLLLRESLSFMGQELDLGFIS